MDWFARLAETLALAANAVMERTVQGGGDSTAVLAAFGTLEVPASTRTDRSSRTDRNSTHQQRLHPASCCSEVPAE